MRPHDLRSAVVVDRHVRIEAIRRQRERLAHRQTVGTRPARGHAGRDDQHRQHGQQTRRERRVRTNDPVADTPVAPGCGRQRRAAVDDRVQYRHAELD